MPTLYDIEPSADPGSLNGCHVPVKIIRQSQRKCLLVQLHNGRQHEGRCIWDTESGPLEATQIEAGVEWQLNKDPICEVHPRLLDFHELIVQRTPQKENHQL
jgi:hypothetical protein